MRCDPPQPSMTFRDLPLGGSRGAGGQTKGRRDPRGRGGKTQASRGLGVALRGATSSRKGFEGFVWDRMLLNAP